MRPRPPAGDDDEPVRRVRLRGGGLTADLASWGATLQALHLDGHPHPLTLGFPDIASYRDHSPYFGQTPGRFANRIDGGRLVVDGTVFALERNENGANHLHGGRNGIGRRNWRLVDHDGAAARFEIVDPDGQSGYPGNCRITCRYRLAGAGRLAIDYEAVSDRPTPCNIAHHSYFNLDGAPTILDHVLEIAAEHYLPTRPDQIPTGEIAPVAGTAFDFRQPRPVRRNAADGQVLYDHNFCLSRAPTAPRRVARVESPVSGVSLEVFTTATGLQFYCGYKIRPSLPGLSGAPYGPFAGLCLETQGWPDAPNHAHFPTAILRPGQVYRHGVAYVFRR